MQIAAWFIVALVYSSLCGLIDKREVHKIKYTILCFIGTFVGVAASYRLGIHYLGFDFVTLALTFYSTLAFLLVARVIENIIFAFLKRGRKQTSVSVIKTVEV